MGQFTKLLLGAAVGIIIGIGLAAGAEFVARSLPISCTNGEGSPPCSSPDWPWRR